jgi:hypothetical protein
MWSIGAAATEAFSDEVDTGSSSENASWQPEAFSDEVDADSRQTTRQTNSALRITQITGVVFLHRHA